MRIRHLVPSAAGALAFALALPQTGRGQAAPAASPVGLGGVVYAQYFYQLGDTANHANNFDVTRAYVNLTGRFADGLATRVTGDVYRNADGSRAFRLKYAYAAYTPSGSPLTFKLGLIHTALLDWEEALWDYRMQGTMPMERGGYVSSADFGAGVDGHWNGERVNLQVAAVNGEYYSGTPGDEHKDIMGRVSVRLSETSDASRVGGLRLTGYAHLGAPNNGGRRNRFLAMLSYRSSLWTLAGQAAVTRDAVGTPAPPSIPGRVLSAYGVYRVRNSHVALLGRVDVTDPDTDIPGNRTTRFIAGASHQLTPNLRLLGDFEHTSYEGPPSPAQYAARWVALFQTQFTF